MFEGSEYLYTVYTTLSSVFLQGTKNNHPRDKEALHVLLRNQNLEYLLARSRDHRELRCE